MRPSIDQSSTVLPGPSSKPSPHDLCGHCHGLLTGFYSHSLHFILHFLNWKTDPDIKLLFIVYKALCKPAMFIYRTFYSVYSFNSPSVVAQRSDLPTQSLG